MDSDVDTALANGRCCLRRLIRRSTGHSLSAGWRVQQNLSMGYPRQSLDRLSDEQPLGLGQAGMDRDRHHFARQPLGAREARSGRHHVAQGRLLV